MKNWQGNPQFLQNNEGGPKAAFAKKGETRLT